MGCPAFVPQPLGHSLEGKEQYYRIRQYYECVAHSVNRLQAGKASQQCKSQQDLARVPPHPFFPLDDWAAAMQCAWVYCPVVQRAPEQHSVTQPGFVLERSIVAVAPVMDRSISSYEQQAYSEEQGNEAVIGCIATKGCSCVQAPSTSQPPCLPAMTSSCATMSGGMLPPHYARGPTIGALALEHGFTPLLRL